jgi:hypothetical protein
VRLVPLIVLSPLLLEIVVEAVEDLGAARDPLRVILGRTLMPSTSVLMPATSVRPNLSSFRSMSWMISAMARSAGL